MSEYEGPLTPEEIGSQVPDVAPDSSAGEGVQEGTAPGSGEQPPTLADGTSPDKAVPYSRFSEEVTARKALEAELDSLRGIVSEDPELMNRVSQRYGMPQTSGDYVPAEPAPAPAPEPQGEISPDEDPAKWLQSQISSVLDQKLAPVTEFMQQQSQVTQAEKAQRIYAEFKTANPDYDEARDGVSVANVLRQRRAGNWQDAWTLTKVGKGTAPTPESPHAEVRSAGSAPMPADVVAMKQKLATEQLSPWEREQLAEAIFGRIGDG